MSTHSIIYLGDIEQFNINPKLIKEKLSCSLVSIKLELDLTPIFEQILTLSPKLILIEATNIDNDFLSFLLLLKTHTKTKQTKIIAIFPDKNNLELYSDIYSFGVEYGFILGEEQDQIINTLGLFLNDSDFKPIQYAKAINLYIPAQVSFIAKISHITEHNISIETSLNLKGEESLDAKVYLDEKIQLNTFEVLRINTFLPRSYFSHSADLKITFNELTSSNDFLNFLIQNQDQTFHRNDPALIIDNRPETLAELIYELNANNKFIKITNSFSLFEDEFRTFLPRVICYQMEEERDDMADDDCLKINGPTTFNRLIQKIKSIPSYNPYVLVFHDRSRSRAYRKAYQYNNIIVNKKSFEIDYLSMIIEGYQENNPVTKETFYFRPPDKRTIFEIKKEIIITSISENHMTFLYEGELKDYTTFKISSPLHMYITNIPTTQSLENKPPHNHFFGILSNTNEEDKMELRKLVNLLIEIEPSPEEPLVLQSVEQLRENIIKERMKTLLEERESQKEEYEKEN